MILLVGGTGFIGKNLLLRLGASGVKTTVVSRQPDREFLARFSPLTTALTLEQFYSDPSAALFDCRSVVYLASSSTPGSNLTAPWREATHTVEPLLRMIKAVVDHSDAHFVFLSSGGTVYGPCNVDLLTEDLPLNPISPYGLGKKMCEAVVQHMATVHRLRQTILRPANPIGRWQESQGQGVVGALLRAARDGTSFPMIGDGTAIRDYFDVSDLAAAIIATLQAPDKSSGRIWNVGSGHGHSVSEMLNMVRIVTGRNIEVKPLPPRDTDVDRVVLDINGIRAALGWSCQVDLEDGIQDVWRNLINQDSE